MSRDLNDTLIFVKVVEQGSFTSAARVLGLPKTTVSRKVQDLEERLGARLIHRTTRRLGLTEAGQVYYEHSQRIARELDDAESAVHQLEGGPRGWLRFTAPFSLALNALSPMIIDFRERHPEVRVEMVLSNDRLDLIANEIDVALRFGPLPDSSFAARKLASYSAHVYASEIYLANHGEPLTPEDLQHHIVLAMPKHRRGTRYCWPLTNGQRDEEFPIQPVVIANDPFVLRPMLLAGHGLMLASDVVIRPALEAGCVRRVLSPWTGPSAELNAVFPRGPVLSPKVRAFVDFVAERLAVDEHFEQLLQSCDSQRYRDEQADELVIA